MISVVRTSKQACAHVRVRPVKMRRWSHTAIVEILGIPVVPFNNTVAEERIAGFTACRGISVDYESTQTKNTTPSTAAADVDVLMKCVGECRCVGGLCMDLTGLVSPIVMNTIANNRVTTAGTTRLPEQIDNAI